MKSIGQQIRQIAGLADTASATALTERDVHLIREMLERGVSDRAVAARFGVSCGTIQSIARGKSWKHVP